MCVCVCVCTRICVGFFFSGFSVGFCINEERRLSVTNYSSENNLPTFRLNAPVVIRAKVNKVRTKHYYL